MCDIIKDAIVWYKPQGLNNKIVKTQAYKYSCYPCSLHMALVNMRYLNNIKEGSIDNSVEEYFNFYIKAADHPRHNNLNEAGPTSVEQLYLITLKYLDVKNILVKKYNLFYTRLGINAISISKLFDWNKEERYVAIVFTFTNMGHATVIYKDGNKYTYIYTSSENNIIENMSLKGSNLEITPPSGTDEYSYIKFEGIIEGNCVKETIAQGDGIFIFK